MWGKNRINILLRGAQQRSSRLGSVFAETKRCALGGLGADVDSSLEMLSALRIPRRTTQTHAVRQGQGVRQISLGLRGPGRGNGGIPLRRRRGAAWAGEIRLI